MEIFSIEFIVFRIGSYPLSLIELLGTLTGLLSVWWAARVNIWTWPSGVFNIIYFFLLFYQTQLYSDMLLQVFFMATTIYGWRNWAKNAQAKELSVGKLENKDWLIYLFYLATGAIIWGLLMSRIHILMPAFFPQPAALPFIDAFTAIASVLATILLAQKKWESWLLWVIIDAISVFVYFYKGLYVVGAEYIVFFCIAGYGLYNWRKGLSFEK